MLSREIGKLIRRFSENAGSYLKVKQEPAILPGLFLVDSLEISHCLFDIVVRNLKLRLRLLEQ